MSKIEWKSLDGHAGLQFRKYDNGLSFRFRQRNFPIDFLGIMEPERAIRIAGELRENRKMMVGPQSWKVMQEDKAEAKTAAVIVEKKERKKVIAAERLEQENTVAKFWDAVYWPQRSQTGSMHNNKSMLGDFNNHVRPLIGNIPLQDLTFSDVDSILKRMDKKRLASKTIRNIYTTLQSEWNYAAIYLSAHNKISLPVFPGKMLKLKKMNNQKTCYLEKNEAALLLKTLYNWHDTLKLHKVRVKGRDTKDAYGMAMLSILSGLRLGDICRLTWSDVQTAMGHARTPKGGHAYGIHLDVPGIKEMIEERRGFFPNAKPTDFVFLDSNGNQWKEAPQTYEDAVAELGLNFTPRRMGNPLESIDFHALRHTFASWLAMEGTSLQTIMVLMGHESITMTLRYARLNPAYTRKPVEELAAEFAKAHKIFEDEENGMIYVENVNVLNSFDKQILQLQ